jgi:hypothetical protein
MRDAQMDVSNFAAWLAKNGAEIGIPSNPYEVIRYRAYPEAGGKAETHIVYRKESGALTWTGASQSHYSQFASGEAIYPATKPYQPDARGDTPFLVTFPAKGKAPTRAKLLERDGDKCWFCGDPMGDDITIEHLVPKSAGGRNMAANYALAHKRCNHQAADLPLVDKIELRQRMRSQFRMLAG